MYLLERELSCGQRPHRLHSHFLNCIIIEWLTGREWARQRGEETRPASRSRFMSLLHGRLREDLGQAPYGRAGWLRWGAQGREPASRRHRLAEIGERNRSGGADHPTLVAASGSRRNIVQADRMEFSKIRIRLQSIGRMASPGHSQHGRFRWWLISMTVIRWHWSTYTLMSYSGDSGRNLRIIRFVEGCSRSNEEFQGLPIY